MGGKVIISPDMLGRAELFADRCVDTVDYSYRGQTNKDKIRRDILIGKLGEEVAAAEIGEGFSPDYGVYSAKQKSWDMDFGSYHVKTQVSAQSMRYGESWVFQGRDKHIFGPRATGSVVFVRIADDFSYGRVRFIGDVSWLHSNGLFKLPVRRELRDKFVVYYKDLLSVSRVKNKSSAGDLRQNT